MENTTTNPSGRNRNLILVMMAVLYILLSVFSLIELWHLCDLVTMKPLRFKVMVAFGIAVHLPILLTYYEHTLRVKRMKIVLEILPILIVMSLFILSSGFTKEVSFFGNVICIITCDVVSSILLSLFGKILHGKQD